MKHYIENLRKKRDRLKTRLDQVRSFKAIQSIQTELDNIESLLQVLEQ